jgi:hypothetical protein
MVTKEEIIAFEREIADVFATGVIRAPVHLRAGREDALINIFKEHNIGDDDYVLGFWDSHELALLKGVPREELKQAIIEGEAVKYVYNFDLPATFIVCDNGVSVMTDTRAVWGSQEPWFVGTKYESKIIYFKYTNGYPHSGLGKLIKF